MTDRSGLLRCVSAACLLALAACGARPGAANAPAAAAPTPAEAPQLPPDIAADTAAAAQTPKDQPNFRVCLSSSLDGGADAEPLTISAGVVFESWGRKKGDERNPSLDADMLAPGAIRYEVILDRPVTLSKQTPCAETLAQTVRSPIYEWTLPLVRLGLDQQFQVIGVENHMAFPLAGRLGDLVKRGLIFGYPTADIGNPRELARED